MTIRKKIFAASLLLSTALIAPSLLVGTSAYAAESDTPTAKKYEKSADELIAKNDLKAAQIELKNAVKAAPADPGLRLKLAGVDLRLTDVEGAIIELKAARENKADEVQLTPLLARTYMVQGKFDQLLQEMPTRDDGTPELRASILVVRADAQLALKQMDEARGSLAAAEQLLPQSVLPKLGLARIALTQGQTDDALKKADEIIKITPTADAHILRGEVLMRKNDRDGAIAEYTQAIKIDPNNMGGYLDRAQQYIAANQDEKAEADIKVVLGQQPRLVTGNYLEALILARRKDYPAADVILTKIAGAFPDFPRGYYLQAIVKSAMKQLEQAETSITAYLSHVPDDPLGETVLADTQLRKGNPSGAAESLEKVIAQNPDDFRALTMLGQAYMQSRKPQQALEVYERAQKLAPNDVTVLQNMAINHIATGKNAEGVSELEKSLEISPDSQQASETLVAVYIRNKEFDKAKALIDDMRKRRPADPVPADMAGQVELAQYHLPEAEEAYKAAVKQFPDFAHAKLQLALVNALQNRTDAARDLYKEVVAKDPTNLPGLQNLSVILESQNQPDQVVDLWQKAHRAQPDSLPIALGLVRGLVAKKDFDTSLAMIRDMQLRQPNEPALFAMRAQLELQRGTPKDAVVSLQRQVELKPQDAAARRDLAISKEAAGDLPGAIAAIGDARKLDPNNLRLAAEEVRIIGKQSPEDGITAAHKVGMQMPDQPAAQGMEGDYIQTLKRPAEAKAAYQRAFQVHPSLYLAEKLASVAQRDGKPAEGLKILTDWAAVHPDDLTVKFDLAQYYLSQKNYAEARPRYEALLKERPDNPVMLNDLAWMYQLDHDPRALDLAKKAINASPRSPEVADTVGWIMVQQGDVPNGLKYLQQAHDGLPEKGDILYHFGFALDRSGQKAQAMEVLKKAVGTSEEFDEKKDAEKLLGELSKG